MKKFSKNSLVAVLIILTVAFTLGLNVPTPAYAATAIDLGAAANFAVLAGASVTNVPTSVITGDLGLSPAAGSFYDAGVTQAQVTGTIYAVDASGPAGSVVNPTLLTAAKQALTDAYIDASNQVPATTVTASSVDSFGVGTINNGANLLPGIYKSVSSIGITGTVTLDGGGDPNAVFIFQAGSTLTTATGSVVSLINGAQACNVYWQVGSSAAQLGANSLFKGTLLSDQTVTLLTGANVEGRLMAFTGSVILDQNTITVPTCTAATPTPIIGGTRRDSTINVVKTVINDSGGTKTVADFPLFINGVQVTSGTTTNYPVPGGTYTVTETSDPNYTQTFSGDCDVNGQLTLVSGDNKFCIVTNNDIGAPAAPPVPPLIDVVKVPSPLALPGGPGPVTYTYTLSNIGTVPVNNVTMVGDTCGPITMVSGDNNSNSILETNEVWTYRCATTLTETHTNTIVATGWANGISAVDIASATVVVGEPVVPPLIHVTKVPNPLALTAAGGAVTYTERITNPGTVALSNVNLTDDKCAPLVYVSGDINADSKLDVTETWTYTCRANLAVTTTNTAIASGMANGLTVRDFAIATVVVAAPGLPSAGLPSTSANTTRDMAVLAGIIALTLLPLAVVLRKRMA